MKTSLTFLFTLFTFVMTLQAEAQTEQHINSTITAVRVYRAQAGITEEAKLTLTAGTHQLVFSGLSRSLVAQSVSVSGKGEGIIQAVTQRISYLNRTAKPKRLAELEDSLRVVNNVLDGYQNQQFVIQEEEKLVLTNNQIAGKDNGLNSAELIKVADFYRSRLTELRAAQLSLKYKLEDAGKEVRKIRAEISTLQGQQDEPTNEVVVTYIATTAGPLALTLDYLVYGASWQPEYDLRVPNVGDPIQLALKAEVTNQTGINWKNVSLTLSTANPSQGGTPPELEPQRLDIYQPRRALGYESFKAGSGVARKEASPDHEDAVGVMADSAVPAPAASAADYTQEEIKALSVEYAISIKYDVPTDGKPHEVAVKQYTLPAAYAYFAIPKLDTKAYLRASISGWEQYSLLPGPANVYLEGAYLTRTQLSPDQTEDTLNVGLGQDPAVVIKRERVRDFSSRKFISGSIRQAYGYTIEVRNTKTAPITLTLEDQVPITQDSRIEVKPLDLGSAALEVATGKLTWQLKLAPAESRKLSFSFEVKYPKDQQVTGL